MLEQTSLERVELDEIELEPADLTDDDESILDSLEYPGDLEGDSAVEIKGIADTFAGRMKRERARAVKAIDTEYWVCLCFQNREQVLAFLEKTGWGGPLDKYIDGRKVAKRLGIDLPSDGPPFSKPRISAKLMALVKE